MTWILPIIGIYILIGLIHAYYHSDKLIKAINEIGIKLKYLEQQVSMFQYTQKGGEYYAKLQELHVTESEGIEEYRKMSKGETSYLAKIFIPSLLAWPIYLIQTYRQKEWRH